MKIVNIIGGLGNQMFQYAFALRLAEEFPQEEVRLDTSHFRHIFIKKWGIANLHNGYELEKVFPNISIPKASWRQLLKVTWPIPNYILSRIARRFLPIRKNEYVQPSKSFFTYDKCAFSSQYNYFEGQWECVKFYIPIRGILLREFAHGIPNPTNMKYINNMQCEESVGIHVRRGDYLKSDWFRGICGLDYYRCGIRNILNDGKSHVFYIFSNDMKWCDENISSLLIGSKVIYVTENSGTKSSWDMFLMTYCKDLIIANSSFSWWGAFLNQRGGKIIAPMRWFNRDADYDIWENDWIRI